jgi:hypothetical protein
VASITVTMSEATTVVTTGGTPQLALDIGGTTVQADYTSGSGSTALVFSYTVLAGQTDANGISIAANGLTLNGGTLQDAAGNNAILTHALVADNAAYLVDTTAPVFTSSTTASVAENTPIATTVFDATADGDAGVTYTLAGTDAALFNITAATGLVTFKVSPNYEGPTDAGANNVYDFTVTATDAASNATNQAVQLTVTNVVDAVAPGDTVIDLGSYGKLIAPVQVEGNWYYFWDRSGDGTSSLADITTHDVLDGLFNHDINGVTNTTVANADNAYGTTDTYRYATLNGVNLALPTANGGVATGANPNGTAVSLNTTTNNPTYNDLLAVWDAYNGGGTGTPINGTPAGWNSFLYWSATPSNSGHIDVNLITGHVSAFADVFADCVALQVL